MAAKKKSRRTSARGVRLPSTPLGANLATGLGLSRTQLAAIDAKLKKAGKKPLSFLLAMYFKAQENIPDLERTIKKIVSQYG
jgi:hypothetical protein